MCGIAGCVGLARPEILQGMLRRIKHRGPDDDGFETGAYWGLGNVRLSIIDLAGGHQPLWDSEKKVCLAYNGELYGYQQQRAQLAREGYPFRTQSDTEVLLALYQKHGLDLFAHLNGMFAFALIDESTSTFVLARDHFGIKPILYTMIGGNLYFASEAKAFYAVPQWEPKPDRNAWHAFFNVRFPPCPHTLFNGVKKISPASYLVLRRGGAPMDPPPSHKQIEKVRVGDWHGYLCQYYSLPAIDTHGLDYSESMQSLESALANGVEDQLVSDVGAGVYLSGGLDSSTLCALASRKKERRINTFCLGFGEPSDENESARVIARQFNTHHSDVLLDDNPLSYFKDAIYFMEEPKVNCLQGFLLAREARKFQKVMLSGLGGDELFGGYDIYGIAARVDSFSALGNWIGKPAGHAARAILDRCPAQRMDLMRRQADFLKSLDDPLQVYLLLRNAWDHDPQLVRQIYTKDLDEIGVYPVRSHFEAVFPFHIPSMAAAFMRFELQNKIVDDFLFNEDRMSMAHGLEVRVPFLDRRVVELVSRFPTSFTIRPGQRKRILRDLMKASLPNSILNKKKHGFTFNPVIQFEKDLRAACAQVLTRDRVEEGGLFRYEYIRSILESKPRESLRWHYFLLWKILGYHLWEDVFIRNGGNPSSEGSGPPQDLS